MVLDFKVHEQTLEGVPTTSVPRDKSQNYIKLRFHLDKSWDLFKEQGAHITVYCQDKKASPAVSTPTIIYADDDWTLNLQDYYANLDDFLIMVVGVNADGTVSCPTNALCVTLDKSGTAWTLNPESPDDPAYVQLLAEVNAAIAEVEVDLAKAEDAINKKLPIAEAESSDGIHYHATGSNLPEVRKQKPHIGKGKQIIFIPREQNATQNPKLTINNGEQIEIRMRSESNHGQDEQSPDATDPIPVGALMHGVPYTMTFCGKYWLVDSMIGCGIADWAKQPNKPSYDATEILDDTYGNVSTAISELTEKTAENEDAVSGINAKIPAQASASNQLADKDFVNSSIENVAAYFITKDAAGNPFATKAELTGATVFYSGGQVRVPTRNDYTVVLADESKTISATGENPTTRYIYDNNVWSFQYIVNNSGLTAAQWAAVNSGITAAKVAVIEPSKVFFAEYGITTHAAIANAVEESKIVICNLNNKHYRLQNITASMALFSSFASPTDYRLSVRADGGWASASVTMLKADTIPQATDTALGGIKAAARDASTDTQEVKIDTASGKLYVPQSSGTTNHNELTNRDAAGQHPISAITGLQTALDGLLPMSAGVDHPITGDLYLAVGSSKRIRRLGTPQAEYDAANKKYVDNAISAAIGDIETALASV